MGYFQVNFDRIKMIDIAQYGAVLPRYNTAADTTYCSEVEEEMWLSEKVLLIGIVPMAAAATLANKQAFALKARSRSFFYALSEASKVPRRPVVDNFRERFSLLNCFGKREGSTNE